LIDSVPRGELDDGSVLSVDLPAGKHVLLATDPSTRAHQEHSVQITKASTAELRLRPFAAKREPSLAEAPLQELEAPPAETASWQESDSEPVREKPARSLRRTVGWSAIGVSGAFALATIYSWIRIARINNDSNYLAYRSAYRRGSSPDVCREARRGTLARMEPARANLELKARELCDEGDTLEALQYVFLSGTVLAGATGGYLLWSASKGDASLSVSPSFNAYSAGLSAHLSF
jgi:hypothetical protein